MQNSVIQWMAAKAKLDLVMSIVENKILFVSGTELWTDGQTNRQRRTEAPITRWPQQAFQVGGIKPLECTVIITIISDPRLVL